MNKPVWSTEAKYNDDKQLAVLVAMAEHYGADETYTSTWGKTFEAMFMDEDSGIRFHEEARAYEAQQHFLERLSEEEAAELGLVLED